MWEDCDGINVQEKDFGEGRIICDKTARQVLTDDGILPDFEYRSSQDDSEIDFIHRRLTAGHENTDIYFVINSKDHWEELTGTFRIDNHVPEIWDPETGEISNPIVYFREEGRLTLPLRLSPFGSVFVVFRKPAGSNYINRIMQDTDPVFPPGDNPVRDIPTIDFVSLEKNQLLMQVWMDGEYLIGFNDGREISTKSLHIPKPINIEGPWKIKFPAGWGAPDSVYFNELISWTKSSIEGIKYFSGTAIYEADFIIEDTLLKQNTQYYLDLGVVKDLAEITLNDQILPILWKPPFRADITPWIRSGLNSLEIKITNLWPNRLIGDQWLSKEERYTYTNIGKFTKDSPLLESGLLGPVQIYRVPRKILEY